MGKQSLNIYLAYIVVTKCWVLTVRRSVFAGILAFQFGLKGSDGSVGNRQSRVDRVSHWVLQQEAPQACAEYHGLLMRAVCLAVSSVTSG